jgi:two-component system, NarL family, response regulator LiaR
VRIRVMLVDDHAVVRQGLRMFLSLDPDIDVVGEAGDGAEALRLARDLRPDVVLMDLLMPVMDGIAAIAAIRRELADVEVLALTSVLEDRMVVNAIQAGASGYLLKDTDAPELCRSIKAVAAGQVPLSPRATASLVREITTPTDTQSLTDRETEVLRLVAQGLSNKEISTTLQIGLTTVKNHVGSILNKLGVQSRTHAALYALHAGLVTSTGQGDKT